MITSAFVITAFATLFVIIDPIALTPIFATITQGIPTVERRRIDAGLPCFLFYSCRLFLFWRSLDAFHRDIHACLSRGRWHPLIPDSA